MRSRAALNRDWRWVVQQFALISCISLASTLRIFAIAGVVDPKVQKPIERKTLDWDHSGLPSIFTLSYQQVNDGPGDADRLTIQSAGKQPWVLLNQDDEWGTVGTLTRAALDKDNIVSSMHLFFLSSSPAVNSRIYLILRGAGYGCCEGSLTILTPGRSGTPKVVFHEGTFLPREIVPLKDGTGIQVVGQADFSEAWGVKDAQSYDPYRAYLLKGDLRAQYNENLSKRYTISHYCQWAGPIYDERFAAVGEPTGARHCRTMTRRQFNRYLARHPELVPQRH